MRIRAELLPQIPPSMTTRHFQHARSLRALALALSVIVTASASSLSAQTVGVSLVPTAQRIDWSNELPFKTDWLYGGRLALQFGKYVELQPFYFTRDGYGMDSAKVAQRFGLGAVQRTVDLQHYGTSVQFNLGDGGVVPFVRAGAGVLRLEPEGSERQDRITVSAGGGFRFGIAGLNAELFAEQLSFRMNPQSLFGPDTSAGTSVPTLRNLVYGAAITLPLSAAGDLDRDSDGLRGTTSPIEPFVGVLRYAGAHNLPNQELAGVRAGIDFSPVFGVRGFYWRGVNDDRDGPADVAGYGGEAQFNLNTGPGVSPFLVVGAGQLDYNANFRDSLGNTRDDKTAFIIGGGASLRLSDRVRVNGAIRDYIMTTDESLENVATTGDITHNTMLTAGLTISFGGRTQASDRRGMTTRDDRRTSARETPIERELREVEALREERLLRAIRAEREALEREARDERATPADARRRLDSARVTPRTMTGSDSVRFITVPVPTQGEIILRYGLPSRDSSAVRRDSVVVTPGTPTGDMLARLSEIERRLTARLEAIERQQAGAPGAQAPVVTMVTPSGEPMVVDRANRPVFQRFGQVRSRDLQPYAGFGIRDGDAQIILGARADLGPINPGSGLHFVPELAVGFGSGPFSVLALANVQYAFGAMGGNRSIRPYVTLGGGIYSPTVLGMSTALGSSFRLQPNAVRPLFLNVELQSINLGGQTRLLFGLSRSQ
jgi:hypothetical protein